MGFSLNCALAPSSRLFCDSLAYYSDKCHSSFVPYRRRWHPRSSSASVAPSALHRGSRQIDVYTDQIRMRLMNAQSLSICLLFLVCNDRWACINTFITELWHIWPYVHNARASSFGCSRTNLAWRKKIVCSTSMPHILRHLTPSTRFGLGVCLGLALGLG